MTTIEEEQTMDFVNWEAAGDSTGLDLDLPQDLIPVETSPHSQVQADSSNQDPNMDLVFSNIDGDDFSFWALEHYGNTQEATQDDLNAIVTDPLRWVTPEHPCGHCAFGGYQCKRIKEGKYQGYCTSCVALRCECSFGPTAHNLPSEGDSTFPSNPWPMMGDHPRLIPEHDGAAGPLHNITPQDLTTVKPVNVGDKPPSHQQQQPPQLAKIGARFSRESVKILKNWLSTHQRHPYPSDEEKENLQKQTGLSKQQITGWLANARRRGKIHPTRSTSPHVGRFTGVVNAIDIPKRRGTPALETMNPLQRWANSPPENEPASVTAIARAVTASSTAGSSGSGINSPYSYRYSDDGSSRSLCNQSSASSLGTSQSSGGSFASAFSQKSRGSFGSIPSFARGRRRRRRRAQPARDAEAVMNAPLKTFQCTFCTETFRTKHDWQRHEKSLHLSLERWVCSPDGPKVTSPEYGQPCCVFCGQTNPDDAHIEAHNFSSCTERNVEERTFYRKDHLRQHLKLVHDVKFLPWTMDRWKVASPEIRSRCGFCGIIMDSWTTRTDHLAEHFKTGNTMADWKGDWGFDAPVLEMIENSIPPYLIHDERNTPLPYMASRSAHSSPKCAYELLKVELMQYVSNRLQDTGRRPTDDEMQHEACRIIFSSELLSRADLSQRSWFRDLILSSSEVTRDAMFQPFRGQKENHLVHLKINGKDNIFEDCQLERQLQGYVKARTLLGLTALDSELQNEASRAIARMEEIATNPSEEFANWLLRLIFSSTSWLADFRARAHLPRSEDIGDMYQRSKDPKSIDSTVHNYSRLDTELAEYMKVQRSIGNDPMDADLQRQARIIIYEYDDGWNQTAADDKVWLEHFRQRHPCNSDASCEQTQSKTSGSPTSITNALNDSNTRDSQDVSPLGLSEPMKCTGFTASPGGTGSSSSVRAGPFFFNDANCYIRLQRSLGRFVASTMSPNNPNRHVPTDEELQHQARWIIYDDDDPWNQTAADNEEWLHRFKRETGIIPGDGPGLPKTLSWNLSQGGSGFAPPYVFPKSDIVPIATDAQIVMRDGAKSFVAEAATANKFFQSFRSRWNAPGKVFCSRELESGLAEFVQGYQAIGGFPEDNVLKARARDIMGKDRTPLDDDVLLEKFKTAVQNNQLSPNAAVATTSPMITSVAAPSQLIAPVPVSAAKAGAGVGAAAQSSLLDTNLDLGMTDNEINEILDDMNMDFGEADGNTSDQQQQSMDLSLFNFEMTSSGPWNT